MTARNTILTASLCLPFSVLFSSVALSDVTPFSLSLSLSSLLRRCVFLRRKWMDGLHSCCSTHRARVTWPGWMKRGGGPSGCQARGVCVSVLHEHMREKVPDYENVVGVELCIYVSAELVYVNLVEIETISNYSRKKK